MSTLEIFDPEDVRQFAARCLGAEYLPGVPLPSFCPLHPDLDELALTLLEYRASSGAVPLVHCQQCGFALPLLDFAAEVGREPTPTMAMVARTWPEKVRSGEVDHRVVEALCQQRLRRLILGQGRWLYAAMVVEDGLRPAFGDWSAIPDEHLGTLFSCPPLPPELRGAMYLLHLLRNWMGELVAVDVYAQADYRPLFRHWLVIGHDEPLFAVPYWEAFCDPAQIRSPAWDAAEGHALELEATQQPVGSRRSIWLRCEPQAVLAASAPFEEVN